MILYGLDRFGKGFMMFVYLLMLVGRVEGYVVVQRIGATFSSDTVLAMLPQGLGSEHYLSLTWHQKKPPCNAKWCHLLHVTNSVTSDTSRVPSLYMTSSASEWMNRIYIPINGGTVTINTIPAMKDPGTHQLEVFQRKEGDLYYYHVFVDGQQVHEKVPTVPNPSVMEQPLFVMAGGPEYVSTNAVALRLVVVPDRYITQPGFHGFNVEVLTVGQDEYALVVVNFQQATAMRIYAVDDVTREKTDIVSISHDQHATRQRTVTYDRCTATRVNCTLVEEKQGDWTDKLPLNRILSVKINSFREETKMIRMITEVDTAQGVEITTSPPIQVQHLHRKCDYIVHVWNSYFEKKQLVVLRKVKPNVHCSALIKHTTLTFYNTNGVKFSHMHVPDHCLPYTSLDVTPREVVVNFTVLPASEDICLKVYYDVLKVHPMSFSIYHGYSYSVVGIQQFSDVIISTDGVNVRGYQEHLRKWNALDVNFTFKTANFYNWDMCNPSPGERCVTADCTVNNPAVRVWSPLLRVMYASKLFDNDKSVKRWFFDKFGMLIYVNSKQYLHRLPNAEKASLTFTPSELAVSWINDLPLTPILGYHVKGNETGIYGHFEGGEILSCHLFD